MKHMNLPIAALALFTLAACTAQDENENSNGRTALQVTTAAITTRATNNAWEASDAIGITLLAAETATPVDGKNACKYITSTAAGNFSPADKENTAYFPTQGKSADVLAFYPYTAISSDLLVPVSTASQAKLSQIDLMTAPPAKGHSAVNPNVTLNFRHRLSKLTITVDKEISAADIDLTGATIKVVGTATTAQWSLTNEKLTGESDIADITVPTTTTTADAMSATAIVMPTAAGKDVKLIITTADGKRSYTAPLDAATALMTGTEHFLNVHIKHTQATISVTIADWTTGATLDLPSLTIKTTATDGTAANIHTLTLWSSAAATAKADYTFDTATSQWSSANPFYLENLTDADTFFARHTPTATDVVSTLPDVLGNTAAATQKDGGIALEMKHLLSKLNVSLTRGTGFPATIDLSGATLTLNGFKKTLALSDANVATATATATASAYTATTDASNAASLIVIPQALAVGTEFVVTLKNGSTYTAKLKAALTLTAGNIHTLTLTLDVSELSIALSVAEWTTSSSTQNIIIDGIGDPATGNTWDGDKYTLLIGTGTGATDLSATYAYAADKNTWSSTAPLYWDSFAQGGSYTFYALATPSTAGTPELDYLAASTTTAFGAPILFTGTNTLKHNMSRLTIVLTPGTGYTPADMTNATVALAKGYLKTKTAPTLGTAHTTEAATSTLTIGRTSDVLNTLTLCPQTWAKDADIVNVKMAGTDGASYTIRAKTDFALTASNNHTLTVTIGKTGVSTAFAVTDWGTGTSGSGDGELN